MSKKFCNILIHACLRYFYHVSEAVPPVEGTQCSFVVFGALTCWALLHFLCDLKAAQMSM